MNTIAMRLVASVKRCASDRPTPASDQPMTIMVVDDEESVRRYVDRVLSDAGYRTMLAVDGPDAIAAVARGARFDLLLTDVVMPEMTGAALALRLRENDPDLKVLYLTGYSDRLFEEKTTLSREEAFLEKPFSAVGLRQAVSLAVTGRVTSAVRACGAPGLSEDDPLQTLACVRPGTAATSVDSVSRRTGH